MWSGYDQRSLYSPQPSLLVSLQLYLNLFAQPRLWPGLRQSSSPLTEVVNALPNLLSAVNYFNTQGNANDRVFVTLFAALALLPSDPEHKLPFSIFHNVSRKAQGTSKYYVQLIRLHASGKLVYWL